MATHNKLSLEPKVWNKLISSNELAHFHLYLLLPDSEEGSIIKHVPDPRLKFSNKLISWGLSQGAGLFSQKIQALLGLLHHTARICSIMLCLLLRHLQQKVYVFSCSVAGFGVFFPSLFSLLQTEFWSYSLIKLGFN